MKLNDAILDEEKIARCTNDSFLFIFQVVTQQKIDNTAMTISAVVCI